LPTKAGFTISNVPISSAMLVTILKNMKLEKMIGYGNSEDHRRLWAKYFNLSLVETKARTFANYIVTDGCAVSALVNKKTCLVCGTTDSDGDLSLMRILHHEHSSHIAFRGGDPGVTDVIVVADKDSDKTESYSAARYYHRAKYFLSQRRTNKWNEETARAVATIPTNETASLEQLKRHAEAYLFLAPQLLKHRASKGYRNMRFLRFVHKKQAIDEICDMIAPRDKICVVGIGNWAGANGTPIKRRCVGPLQDIKLNLKGRANVILTSIEEFRTSITCHNCHCQLSNRRSLSTVVNRWKKTKVVRVTKIHKVLHCRSSEGGQGHCGTTWNRDVNAAKNILMLLMLKVLGMERPLAFQRSVTSP
jgi:hypothetical protein